MGRSDSRNPSTTCRGITSSGRPCRRPLAASTLAATNASAASLALRGKYGGRGLRVDDPADENLYCWQHKEQASLSARSSPGPASRLTDRPILEERTSLDTLADRLGLLDVSEPKSKVRKGSGSGGGSGIARQNGEASGSGVSASGSPQPPQRRPPAMMTRPKPKHTVSFCCCFTIPVEERAPLPPTRPKPRPVQSTTPQSVGVPAAMAGKTSNRLTPSPHRPSGPSPASSGAQSQPFGRRHSSTASQTARFLNLIPPHLAPTTASTLLAELAKPFSALDEPGYIYMFWLTPESAPAAKPGERVASGLLAPPETPQRRGKGERRPSDVLESFAGASATGESSRDGGARRDASARGMKKTILLKIGRANNVHRRLNEWTRQCGYDLSLIRFYPYIPSSAAPSPSHSRMSIHHHSQQQQQQPRKMPHSHKVERLIHLELAGMGMRVADKEGSDSKCDTCGKEHREWFEVEATRDAVAKVDEVVRRWVDWDEGVVM